MGVKDLWQLISPVGRRVSIETLEGKTLAIDMSVWLTQFIKAMRDDEGHMIKNAHLLGTLRRILKLMFHRIRPLFVFDGATPQLKMKTIQERRRRRNANDSSKHTNAQKLLLSIVRKNLLEEKLQGKKHKQSQHEISKKSSVENNCAEGSTGAFVDGFHSGDAVSWPHAGTRVIVSGKNGSVDRDGKLQSELRSKNCLRICFDDGSIGQVQYPSSELQIVSPVISSELPISSSSSSYLATANEESAKLHRALAKPKILDSDAADSDDDIDWVDGLEMSSGKILHEDRYSSNAANQSHEESASDDDSLGAHEYMPTAFDFDINVMASLPVMDRKTLAERFRRELRSENRSQYLAVKNDAELYSLTQMAHFKKSVKLNQKLEQVQSLVRGQQEGGTIDGDGQRKYLLLKSSASLTKSGYERDGFVVDDSEEEAEWEDPASYEPTTVKSVDVDSSEFASFSLPQNTANPSLSCELIETNNADYRHSSGTSPSKQAVANDQTEDESQHCVESESDTACQRSILVDLTAHEGFLSTICSTSSAIFESPVCASGHDDGVGLQNNAGGAVSNFRASEDVPRHGNQDNSYSPPGEDSDDDIIWESCDVPVEKAVQAESVIHSPLDSQRTTSPPLLSSAQLATNPPKIASDPENVLLIPQSHCDKIELGNTVVNSAGMTGELGFQEPEVTVHASEIASSFEGASFQDEGADRTARIADVADVSDLPADTEDNDQEVCIFAEIPNEAKYLNPEHGTALLERQEPAQEISAEVLQSMIQQEQEQEVEYRRLNRKAARDADSLSEEMKAEVIALIQAFDLPYIIAPFEAEAQCAVLEKLGLVDGIVTEDSDAFLFGAQSVYRNIFNDKKFVEVYMSSDIKQELGLDRKELVALAYLLGSDYTEGITGIGIVNAMEIVQAFPCGVNADEASAIAGLADFNRWLQGYDFKDTIHELTAKSKGARNKRKIDEEEVIDTLTGEGVHTAARTEGVVNSKLQQFQMKHKSGRSKWVVNAATFPDPVVARAYLSPAASYETSEFKWTVPKLHRVRAFCAHAVGWTESEMDVSIDPVLLRFSQKNAQPKINSFFHMQYDHEHRVAKISSERLQASVAQLVGNDVSNLSLLGSNKKKAKKQKN